MAGATARVIEAMGRPAMRRRLLAMSDQAVFSLCNMLVFILVARSFDTDDPVGAFGLAMVAYTLVLGGIRSLVGEPLLSLYSPVDPSERRRVLTDLFGAVVFLSLASSAVLVVLSLALGGLAGSALLALALVLPLVMLQDAWRYVLVIDRPAAALVTDVVWLAIIVVALPSAPAGSAVSWYVVAWGLGGGVAATVGFLFGGRLPGRPHPWRWLANHRETTSRFFGEFLTAQAAGQLVLAALGAVAGLGALGAAKASMVFYGPLNTAYAGIYLAVVPEGTRSKDRPDHLRRICLAVSVALAGAAVLWMLFGLVLPGSWGRALFGSGVWDEADELMLLMGLAMVAGGTAAGGLVGVRSLADARRSLAARLRTAPWQVACPLLGAVLGGAGGFAVGFAAGHAVAALVWWRAFGQGLGELGAPGPAATGVTEVPEVFDRRVGEVAVGE